METPKLPIEQNCNIPNMLGFRFRKKLRWYPQQQLSILIMIWLPLPSRLPEKHAKSNHGQESITHHKFRDIMQCKSKNEN
jgi:hypothetical protein